MNESLKRTKALETILVLALAAILVFWIFQIEVFLYIGIGILALGLFFKSLAQIIHSLWMKLADVLAYISSRIILSFVFYFILSPIAILYRVFKKKTLFSEPESTQSNFVDRSYLYTKRDIENPW